MTDVPTPNILEQVPAGGNPAAPESGTYGEKADLARLQSSLPPVASPASPAGPAGPSTPPPAGRSARSGGLPPGLLAPSRQPGVDASTPLTARQSPILETSTQRNVAMLETLAVSPSVSQETRDWATLVLNRAKARLQQ